jgi:hypothetical protein
MTRHSVSPPAKIDQEIHVGALLRFTLLLSGLLVASGIGIVGLYLWFDQIFSKADTPPPAVRLSQGERLPPGPHLQARPETELARLRERERQQLEGWAWVDREAGVARVPVAVAMEHMLRSQGAGGLGATAP